mmetsp:Transcript_2585/g.9191  ORF Transcript_2585/g.9191 Transcript_2585/m.9191 type:complete len:369 (+) Transcript_2585:1063-2169(+)
MEEGGRGAGAGREARGGSCATGATQARALETATTSEGNGEWESELLSSGASVVQGAGPGLKRGQLVHSAMYRFGARHGLAERGGDEAVVDGLVWPHALGGEHEVERASRLRLEEEAVLGHLHLLLVEQEPHVRDVTLVVERQGEKHAVLGAHHEFALRGVAGKYQHWAAAAHHVLDSTVHVQLARSTLLVCVAGRECQSNGLCTEGKPQQMMAGVEWGRRRGHELYARPPVRVGGELPVAAGVEFLLVKEEQVPPCPNHKPAVIRRQARDMRCTRLPLRHWEVQDPNQLSSLVAPNADASLGGGNGAEEAVKEHAEAFVLAHASGFPGELSGRLVAKAPRANLSVEADGHQVAAEPRHLPDGARVGLP